MKDIGTKITYGSGTPISQLRHKSRPQVQDNLTENHSRLLSKMERHDLTNLVKQASPNSLWAKDGSIKKRGL